MSNEWNKNYFEKLEEVYEEAGIDIIKEKTMKFNYPLTRSIDRLISEKLDNEEVKDDR